ncbi:DUF418 domain-containing protein [Paenibacillus nasutitermitis]|uniref:DUF418 domain-containing protein n=1 Tax=Paenibacillus nasutitermitis TaxID=1652958 RepID=A0A916ZIY7_9BACL|nr:DUF418 domain-containing protein [Paenibacillus nasutitermitis]GGE00199.1 hypothetical protein GCM10010911_68910 [Paenibacillus nasutitermitis]
MLNETSEQSLLAKNAVLGPVPKQDRALAPDLARGVMLLFIALANCAGIFFAAAPGVEPIPQGWERIYNLFTLMFLHARTFPIFAFMFGYGMIQLAMRQQAAGRSPLEVRTILLRRNGWLLIFGLIHGVLLYSGDILGAYGIAGLLFVFLLLNRSERIYRLVFWYWGVLIVYCLVLMIWIAINIANGSAEAAVTATSPSPSSLSTSYSASLAVRLSEWPMHTALMSVNIVIIGLGAWCAKRRILENPANNLRILSWSAMVGIAAAAIGGLPMGLLNLGVLHADADTAPLIKLLYETTGAFGGVGYVSVFGLIAYAMSQYPACVKSRIVRAITALGQRSLSGYLFQSIVWMAVISPFTLNLGAHFERLTLVAVGTAVVTWLASVIAAYYMDRYGKRGWIEVLLRRLTYGRFYRKGVVDEGRVKARL